MTNAQFIAVKGNNTLSSRQFYIPLVQCERIINLKQALKLLSEKLGYPSAKIRAAFLATEKVLRRNLERGVFSQIDGVATFRINAHGAVANINGPWVKGKNTLIGAVAELDPFKSALAGVEPKNVSEGVKPVIDTVMDEASGEYGVIVGTGDCQIAGMNLAVDTEADDEFVALRTADGTLVKLEIVTSDIGLVKAHLTNPVEAGAYTLVVVTRAGFGSESDVAEATRKVTVR